MVFVTHHETLDRPSGADASWAAGLMDTAIEQDTADPARVATHFERRLAAALEAQRFPGLMRDADASEPEPARIGRYVVVRELGRGGMGVVYLCYDERLDRKVAVKLIATRVPSEAARARLEREAQALARLSHPNVVQIYERGDHYGATFVAMEYVVGDSLRVVLREHPSGDWRRRAAILRECGAALAAAHAQGLVHRDFKPDNVLVGADGRARVLDFGIARWLDDETGDARESSSGSRGSASSDALTRTGTLIGTPAYMSPEQFQARDCDARSDQFSFCVVAFEALLGRRPFAGDTFETVARAVCSGDIVAIPSDTSVPKSLRAAILRGLATQPDARWPDMSALLAELDRVLASRRPRRLAWSLAGGLLVALALPLVRREPASTSPCEFDESALREAWDATARAGARARLDPRIATQVEAGLDEWSAGWLAARRRVCEATHVEGTQSAALLDLRTSCLERQRRALGQIVALVLDERSPADARVIELLDTLPELARCEDPRLAESPHPLPSDASEREAIEQAQAELAAIRSLARLRRYDDVDARLDALTTRVAALDYAPLQAELDGLHGQRALWRRRVAEGVPVMRTAIARAEHERLDELAADLRLALASAAAGTWGSLDVQGLLLDEAELSLARIGRNDDPRSLPLRLARARWHAARGDYEAAQSLLEGVVADARAAAAPDVLTRAKRELGHLCVTLGRFAEAEQHFSDAHADIVARSGESPALVAEHALELGLVHLQRGELDAAAAAHARAQAQLAGLRTPDLELLAMLELQRGKLAFLRGDLDAAAAAFERASERGTDDMRVSEALENRGVIAFYRGEFDDSIVRYRNALELRVATQGPEHPSVGLLYSNLGESQAALGDHEAALESYAHALELLSHSLPPDHLDLAFPYKGRGQSRHALGQHTGAILDLEHALALHLASPGEPVEQADVEFTLARMLDAQGEHARARTLVERAKTRLLDLGHTERAADLLHWLDTHDETSP
jgi:tetratricopeptide (TPR) repeat protein/predicted Ser/Thr protein kinase